MLFSDQMRTESAAVKQSTPVRKCARTARKYTGVSRSIITSASFAIGSCTLLRRRTMASDAAKTAMSVLAIEATAHIMYRRLTSAISGSSPTGLSG